MMRKRKPPVQRPELLLSLNYLPQAERLTIVIMKAKNLETEQDPYVKVNNTKKINIFSMFSSELFFLDRFT